MSTTRTLQLILIFATQFGSTAAAEPCAAPDYLRNNGQLEQAHTSYQKIIDDSANTECAAKGLVEVTELLVSEKLIESAAYKESGDIDKAVALYEAALVLAGLGTQDSAPSLVGLAAIKEAAVAAYSDLAVSMMNAQDYVRAKSAYEKILSYDPNKSEAVYALADINYQLKIANTISLAQSGDMAGATKAYVEASKNDPTVSTNAVQTVPGLAAYFDRQHWYTIAKDRAIDAMLLIIALYVLVRFLVRYFGKSSLDIEDFEATSLQSEIGPTIAAKLKSNIIQLTKGSSDSGIGIRIAGGVQQFDIPAAISQSLPAQLSWATAIPALARKIFPRRVDRVTGSLHYSETYGSGITVNLKLPRKPLQSHTFWQRSYGDDNSNPEIVAPYYDLGQYVAVWVVFKLDDAGDFLPLGCRDWRAYSQFLAGVNADSRKDQQSARRCYVQALRYQLNFNAPRYNLSLLVSGKNDYAFTIPPLERVAEHCDSKDPTRYNARYTLANRLYVTGRPEDALGHAGTLVNELQTKINDLKRDSKRVWESSIAKENRVNLLSFLEFTLPIATSLKIGLAINANRDLSQLVPLMDLRSQAATPRTHYNVGCAFSLAAEIIRTSSVDDEDQDESAGPESSDNSDSCTLDHGTAIAHSLESIRTALFLHPSFKSSVGTDPSLEELRQHSDIEQDIAPPPPSGPEKAEEEVSIPEEVVKALGDWVSKFLQPNEPQPDESKPAK